MIQEDIPQDIQDLIKTQKFAEALSVCESRGQSTSFVQEYISNTVKEATKDFANRKYQHSIDLYITTIGVVEPAVVLRQYIAPHLSVHLTKYLMELHYRGFANQKHTRLLFNLFSQSDAHEALNSFINRIKIELESPGKLKSLFLSNFSGTDAIQILIENQKQSEALLIAKLLDLPDKLVHLLITYKHDCQAAADLILSRIKDPCGRQLLMEYGPTLLEPSAKTAQKVEKAAIELWLSSDSDQSGNAGFDSDHEEINLEKAILSIFLSTPNSLFQFLLGVIQTKPTTLFANTFLSLVIGQNDRSQTSPNSPNDQSDQRFSEKSQKGTRLVRSEQILNYLNDPNLLQAGRSYEPEVVLRSCREAHFTEGTVCLLEKLGRTKDVVSFLIAEREPDFLRRWCDGEPKLADEDWAEVFLFFVGKDGWSSLPSDAEETSRFLRMLVQKTLNVWPLQTILARLSENPEIPLETIKAMLSFSLGKLQEERKEAGRKKAELLEELRKIEGEIDHLETGVVNFSPNQCSKCGEDLKPPIIAFFCGHYFHINCCNETKNGYSCPICGACDSPNPEEIYSPGSEIIDKNTKDLLPAIIECTKNGFLDS